MDLAIVSSIGVSRADCSGVKQEEDEKRTCVTTKEANYFVGLFESLASNKKFIKNTMKLTSLLLVASSFLAASAFGVSPKPALTKPSTTSVGFLKESAVGSALFRDQSKVRGGAVPGWAAYNDALDKKPLITKAMTSLVGWALGDILAQVCHFYFIRKLCFMRRPRRRI